MTRMGAIGLDLCFRFYRSSDVSCADLDPKVCEALLVNGYGLIAINVGDVLRAGGSGDTLGLRLSVIRVAKGPFGAKAPMQ